MERDELVALVHDLRETRGLAASCSCTTDLGMRKRKKWRDMGEEVVKAVRELCKENNPTHIKINVHMSKDT